jgi:hypothetical protein
MCVLPCLVVVAKNALESFVGLIFRKRPPPLFDFHLNFIAFISDISCTTTKKHAQVCDCGVT